MHTFSFFLLAIQHRKEKACQEPCHHWWCFALFTGLFVCCIFHSRGKRLLVLIICIPGHIYVPLWIPPCSLDFIIKSLRTSSQLFLYHIILWKSRQMERWPGWNSSYFTWKKICSACGKRKNPWFYKGFHSYWRESDPWPPHYQCDALPTEPQ